MLSDFKYALRQILKFPGYTAIVAPITAAAHNEFGDDALN